MPEEQPKAAQQQAQTTKLEVVSTDAASVTTDDIDALVEGFIKVAQPIEKDLSFIHIFVDERTGARFFECHILASNLISLGTVDVPLDPEEQSEYRANRDIVFNAHAFHVMKDDAAEGRSFSNLVLEYVTDYDSEHPLKVIGGQHRFEAIRLAYEAGVNAYHGVKVYFGLNSEQRYDVQLISNTVIAVSTDLYDRMSETVKGPELRQWCQRVGLLEHDFADKRERGKEITVRAARSFIVNFYHGKALTGANFSEVETAPELCKSGETDLSWDAIRRDNSIWTDVALETAGREFVRLVEAQRKAFENAPGRTGDSQEKALNYAVLTSWALVAGLLQNNPTRLQRHFDLANRTGRDPMNATALAKGRHKTDPPNYRGVGQRTDPKERGRLVELFLLQAENGGGITSSLIDVAIKQYHAKQAVLEVQKAKTELSNNGRN